MFAMESVVLLNCVQNGFRIENVALLKFLPCVVEHFSVTFNQVRPFLIVAAN